MNSHDRLSRLRALAFELEGRGSSPECQALLREIRERIALLEIGAEESSGWSKRGWDAGDPADQLAALVLEH